MSEEKQEDPFNKQAGALKQRSFQLKILQEQRCEILHKGTDCNSRLPK